MRSSGVRTRAMLRTGALLVVLLVTGCAGFEPYEPRDYREEGLEQGLFSGEAGEFVIFRRADNPDSGNGTSEHRMEE